MPKSPTVENLKKRAKLLGFRGYSKLRKAVLKEMLYGKKSNAVQLYVYIPEKNRFRTFANIIAD